MADNKSQLVFSADQSSVHIVFADGAKSDIFETKEDILEAMLEHFRQEKITEQEAMNFFDEVMQSNLRDSGSRVTVIEVSGGPEGMLGMFLLSALFSDNNESESSAIEDIEFAMCNCNPKAPKHAYFKVKETGMPIGLAVESKAEAEAKLARFIKRGLPAEKADALRALINSSELPQEWAAVETERG